MPTPIGNSPARSSSAVVKSGRPHDNPWCWSTTFDGPCSALVTGFSILGNELNTGRAFRCSSSLVYRSWGRSMPHRYVRRRRVQSLLLAFFESQEASAAKAWFLDRACLDSKVSGLLPCDLATKFLFWVLYGSPGSVQTSSRPLRATAGSRVLSRIQI